MTHQHRRRWVKLWTQEAIAGATRRELTPAQRSVWWDFLALAGDSMTPGVVAIAPGIPYTDDQLVTILNISPSLLRTATAKMIRYGKVRLDTGCIIICNWEHYQADYERVRKFRDRAQSSDSGNSPQMTSETFGVSPRSKTTPFPNLRGVTKVTQGRDVTKVTLPPEEEGRGGRGGVVKRTHVSIEDNNSTQRHAHAGNFPRACELYTETFGKVTQKARARLYKMCLDFELAWIEAAFKEAQNAGATRINYVDAVLERWGRDGYKASRPRDARYPPTAAQRRALPDEKQLEKEWAASETPQ